MSLVVMYMLIDVYYCLLLLMRHCQAAHQHISIHSCKPCHALFNHPVSTRPLDCHRCFVFDNINGALTDSSVKMTLKGSWD